MSGTTIRRRVLRIPVDGGLTLVGFLRGAAMNVYAGAHRVVTEDAAVTAVAAAG